MSLLMGPAPRGNNNGIPSKVTSDPQRPTRLTGVAGKLSKAFHEALDSISFSPWEFGLLIHAMPAPMQYRFIEMVHAYFHIKNDCIERGMHKYVGEEEYDLMVNGKRIHQALSRFPFRA